MLAKCANKLYATSYSLVVSFTNILNFIWVIYFFQSCKNYVTVLMWSFLILRFSLCPVFNVNIIRPKCSELYNICIYLCKTNQVLRYWFTGSSPSSSPFDGALLLQRFFCILDNFNNLLFVSRHLSYSFEEFYFPRYQKLCFKPCPAVSWKNEMQVIIMSYYVSKTFISLSELSLPVFFVHLFFFPLFFFRSYWF